MMNPRIKYDKAAKFWAIQGNPFEDETDIRHWDPWKLKLLLHIVILCQDLLFTSLSYRNSSSIAIKLHEIGFDLNPKTLTPF